MSEEPTTFLNENDGTAKPHRRRVRYSGKNPRHFSEKYKEHDPARYVETAEKILSSGKTLAGTHRPIMVSEILDVLSPKPGEIAVDGTLGFGGHAREILSRIQPDGRLLGLDVDPIELPKTEARLRALGFGAEVFSAHRSNFAGIPQALASASLAGADILLVDLGVSSMQLDDPSRGFSTKFSGPLDMRMNPQRGEPASIFLEKISAVNLQNLLVENSDEPHAAQLAPVLAGRKFETTTALAKTIHNALPRIGKEQVTLSIRRVFQALRIAVNDEFSALDTFLRNLRFCLNPRGRVAVLTFHSGEDRRVKKSFQAGLRDGFFSAIADEIVRPSREERRENPRSNSAKLRWAIRSE